MVFLHLSSQNVKAYQLLKFFRHDCYSLIKSFLVDNCGVINGGCSHTCTEHSNNSDKQLICSCVGTSLVIDPNGDPKQCG